MLHIERWKNIVAQIETGQRFMDMLCSSAVADYRSRGKEIFCAKGCGSCCTLAVNCTAAEALLVANALDNRQEEKLKVYVDRLKEVAAAAGDLKDYLRLHRKELGGCPFLDHGVCGIYAVRPISCRALLSTRESFWCGADFSELQPEEKQAFVESLDRSQVAFPMHYLASTRDAGQKLETQAGMQMLREFGFSLYGSMPVLVYLFRDSGLLESFAEGGEAALAVAASAGLDSPFLMQVEKL